MIYLVIISVFLHVSFIPFHKSAGHIDWRVKYLLSHKCLWVLVTVFVKSRSVFKSLDQLGAFYWVSEWLLIFLCLLPEELLLKCPAVTQWTHIWRVQKAITWLWEYWTVSWHVWMCSWKYKESILSHSGWYKLLEIIFF